MNPTEDPGTKAYNRAVINLQGKLRNSFLNNYPHHAAPGYNLSRDLDVDESDVQSALELYKEFPYGCEFPKPLLPPARLPECVLRDEDPALQLLTMKSQVKDDIDRITEYHLKYKKNLIQCNKKEVKWTKGSKNKKKTVLPRYVAELAEIVESDPDPQFQGEYNWYYTGGSLNSLHLADTNLLLFPYAEDLVASPILEREKLIWKPHLKNAARCSIDGTLYELRHNIGNNFCRVLGRFKDHCILYSLSQSESKWMIIEIQRKASQIPYISADLNPIDQNKYCVVNTDRLLELCDINRIKRLSDAEILKTKVLADNWASVKFQQSDPNIIMFVDRCCLHYIDVRVPFEKPSFTLCPKTYLENCDELSLNFPSRYNTMYQYLGAYHSLLMCDCRFDSASVIQKWTHQFKCAPLLADITNRNEEEIVVISSQISGENSIILNNWSHENKMHSYCLPYMPSSILETLEASQMQGKCLDTFMKDRLGLSNAGTTLVTNDSGHVSLFSQNSIGDIFYQCITHAEPMNDPSIANGRSVFVLDVWEKAISTQRKTIKPLVISEKVNMTHVFNAMMHSKQQLESNNEPKMRYGESKWKQSMTKLNSYVDVLAPELLAVWDVTDDSTSLPMATMPHQKVLSWLEKATEKSSSDLAIQSQEVDEYQPSQVNTQELLSVSQAEPVLVQDNDFVHESYHLVPKTEMTKKKPVKKRKYISGF